MISDRDCAQACFDTYAYAGPTSWDWQQIISGVWVAIRRVADGDIVALRGSTTFEDWIRDMLAVSNPIEGYGGLGPVHPGFYVGMVDVWAAVAPLLRAAWVCTGHSLGAGRCCILTGLALIAGKPPARYVRFGEPRPGFDTLAKLLEPVAGVSYRAADEHGHDLVTDVPFDLPPFEDYVHPQALTDAVVHPPANDAWLIFRYHHMAGYLAALTPRSPPPT